ncbi:MAG: metal-sensitive transcriptional regulator [Pseudomonadota bacterium]|nr:metal-sensitive transcriptional regulator [Pseudomonadota bacterium]
MSDICASEVYLEEAVERSIRNRLSRIEGQVRGIKRMLAEHQSCDEILIQLAALRNAVNGVAHELLEGHMETCVLESVRSGRGEEAFARLQGALAQYLRHA